MNKEGAPCVRTQMVLVFASAMLPLGAQASLGPFEHGAGIKAMGAGGVSYVAATETTALSANPAFAANLGGRYDVGIDVLNVRPMAHIEGNAISADDNYASDGRNWYPIPQAGFVRPLGEKWAVGVTLLAAGLGPDYPDSPYQRFGGAQRTSLALGSANLVPVLAWRPTPDQSIGAGVVLGYQTVRVEGLQFLAAPDGPGRVSTDPDKVTNHGKDGAFSLGFTVGWTGQLSPQFSAGVGYRSKAWTQKHDDYRGLLPDHGKLELPAVYGIGVAWKPVEAWTFAMEWQRYEYESEKAFGNPISKLSSGDLLGSANGPGFGLLDQNAFKFGLTWRARPGLDLRAGYVRANQNIQRSDTLFPLLAPVAMTTHYTAGLTYGWREWEISGALTHCPRQNIDGSGSIPPAFGGGEANLDNAFTSYGLSLGKRF